MINMGSINEKCISIRHTYRWMHHRIVNLWPTACCRKHTLTKKKQQQATALGDYAEETEPVHFFRPYNIGIDRLVKLVFGIS